MGLLIQLVSKKGAGNTETTGDYAPLCQNVALTAGSCIIANIAIHCKSCISPKNPKNLLTSQTTCGIISVSIRQGHKPSRTPSRSRLDTTRTGKKVLDKKPILWYHVGKSNASHTASHRAEQLESPGIVTGKAPDGTQGASVGLNTRYHKPES